MQKIIEDVLYSVLSSLYQPFWLALVLAFCALVISDEVSKVGAKHFIKIWKDRFTKKDNRYKFYFWFYASMILYRTVLNRTFWKSPLSDVIGVWGLYNSKGEFTTEIIENLLLFVPFSFLFMKAYYKKRNEKVYYGKMFFLISKLSFFTSFGIEMMQLIFRVGTWQLSDLFFNTIGGMIGAIGYLLLQTIKYRK